MKKLIYPDYYKTFRCTADQCPDTCCQGWNIVIEPKACENWKRLGLEDHMKTIPFGKSEVHHIIAMDQKTLHCPLLTDKGLCSVVLQHGDEMIPHTCQEFPRHEVEEETVLQKSLAIRCPAVLDLLWDRDIFSYIADETLTFDDYPAGAFLDKMLGLCRADADGSSDVQRSFTGNMTSAGFLHHIFLLCLGIHQRMKANIPTDENGYQEYGQELMQPEHIDMVAELMAEILAESDRNDAGVNDHMQDPQYDNEEPPELRLCHDLMYEVMREFFKHPLFGTPFTELFYQSQDLLHLREEEQWERFRNTPLSPELDKKLLLVVQEELFHSVFTAEVRDYETVLVRLQWLILQYLVIRYIIYLDFQKIGSLTTEHLRRRILYIFRVTDLPDIVKISFFDTSFKNWMWSEESAEIRILRQCEKILS